MPITPKLNSLKKYLGIVWILLGPLGIIYLISTALSEIAKKPVIDTKIQWIVFVGVFIPIAIGMMVFGWYALQGEYEKLPASSEEIIQDED
jgi:purine-cytosine permease-like protein